MPEDNEDRRQPYTVLERDDRFEVRNASSRVIMVCGDKGSAEHYALLLNEAFESGYRMGFRDGRNTRLP